MLDYQLCVLLGVAVGLSLTNAQVTMTGTECYPVYQYKGIDYTGCITVDNFKAWCGTAPVVKTGLAFGTWGYCLEDDGGSGQCDVQTLAHKDYGNSLDVGDPTGEICKFPFKYKGKMYEQCIALDHSDGMLWCPHHSPYSNSGNKKDDWGYCKPVKRQVTDSGASIRCHFPFEYKNDVYYTCTSVRNGGVPWCSEDAVYVRRQTSWADCEGVPDSDLCFKR